MTNGYYVMDIQPTHNYCLLYDYFKTSRNWPRNITVRNWFSSKIAMKMMLTHSYILSLKSSHWLCRTWALSPSRVEQRQEQQTTPTFPLFYSFQNCSHRFHKRSTPLSPSIYLSKAVDNFLTTMYPQGHLNIRNGGYFLLFIHPKTVHIISFQFWIFVIKVTWR